MSRRTSSNDAPPSAQARLQLAIQYPDDATAQKIPRWRVRRWVQCAIETDACLTVRFTSTDEQRMMNRDFRGKDYATNVLTFVYEHDPISADIAVCLDVVQAEADQQGKAMLDHCAHLVIHGALHAQGYDHESDDQARQMEALEVSLLKRFRISDPYQDGSGAADLGD